jgi:hypothetical protein
VPVASATPAWYNKQAVSSRCRAPRPLEGQINRLKMLKGTMYGRVGSNFSALASDTLPDKTTARKVQESPQTRRKCQLKFPSFSDGLGKERGRLPAYCSRGVRCEGGVTLILANARNLRTCLSMPREKVQAAEITERRAGADRSVVVTKPL